MPRGKGKGSLLVAPQARSTPLQITAVTKAPRPTSIPRMPLPRSGTLWVIQMKATVDLRLPPMDTTWSNCGGPRHVKYLPHIKLLDFRFVIFIDFCGTAQKSVFQEDCLNQTPGRGCLPSSGVTVLKHPCGREQRCVPESCGLPPPLEGIPRWLLHVT